MDVFPKVNGHIGQEITGNVNRTRPRGRIISSAGEKTVLPILTRYPVLHVQAFVWGKSKNGLKEWNYGST